MPGWMVEDVVAAWKSVLKDKPRGNSWVVSKSVHWKEAKRWWALLISELGGDKGGEGRERKIKGHSFKTLM